MLQPTLYLSHLGVHESTNTCMPSPNTAAIRVLKIHWHLNRNHLGVTFSGICSNTQQRHQFNQAPLSPYNDQWQRSKGEQKETPEDC